MRITRHQRAQTRWALECLVTVSLGFLAVLLIAQAIRTEAWVDRATAGGGGVVAALLCGLLLVTRGHRWPARSS